MELNYFTNVRHKCLLPRLNARPLQAVLPPCVQAYLEVADQSGAMSLVLWSELCLDWYHSLHVGAVLYIHKYTVKDSYANRSRPQMEHHCLRVFRSKGAGGGACCVSGGVPQFPGPWCHLGVLWVWRRFLDEVLTLF